MTASEQRGRWGLETPEASESRGGDSGSRTVRSPSVLLIDDGELEDVKLMLEQAGAQPLRLRGGAARRGWRQPKHILIVTGRRALTLGRPVTQEQEGFKKLAIFDEESKTLRERLQGMGFDHIVRRPVHPEALRLLVVGALFGESEKRAEPRLPFGCEVRWRSGWRRGRATLSEISTRGASMQVPKGAKPRNRLELRIPAGAAGNEAPLTLAARVIGSRPTRSPGDTRGLNLSVLFERLDQRTCQHLAALLAHLKVGPPTLGR